MIPFNKPYLRPGAGEAAAAVLASGRHAGNGPATRACEALLARALSGARTLLTPSCTAALEMAMILAEIGPGDEVILPSFTFVSTANAVALRGATPVFVDIRSDTLNLDDSLVEAAVTDRTRAILVVHYAGVGAALDSLTEIAARRGLMIVEDAAQGLGARWRDRPLGCIGALGALSFHETKNLGCGEGGALIVNDPALAPRAEIIREKGTNRSQFLRGEIDKYSWVDLGSSFLASDLTAGFLTHQLAGLETVTARRLALWQRYHQALEPLEAAGLARRPNPPPAARHNGHIYHLLFDSLAMREAIRAALGDRGIQATSHFVPLHTAAAGLRYGRTAGPLPVTARVADGILRLPLYHDLTHEEQDRVIEAVLEAVRGAARRGSR